MDKDTRNRIQRATQAARALLEDEFAEQLEGRFDIHLDGTMASGPGSHLNAGERVLRAKLVAAVEHLRSRDLKPAEAVAGYLREAAFTLLNRFVALKMLEARGLVQECLSRGEQSAGFREFAGLAPGLVQLPDHGYRLYIECLFDEIGREIRVLFDRRDAASLLWPRRQALADLLDILNDPDLARMETEDEQQMTLWHEDETIGWVYQYFNRDEERRQMRAESQAPRTSRELAVRNQFFTPRYVVEFLVDNTLGRTWYEMRNGKTGLVEQCQYLVQGTQEAGEGEQETQAGVSHPTSIPSRARKDPRDLKLLDPACGSGHFLLYAFDVLLVLYEEAWADAESPVWQVTGQRLGEDYPDLAAFRAALPGLILRHNLHGIDIDPRCVQIAALALWMRAQRAYTDFGIPRAARPPITRTNIVVAEPMPGEQDMVEEFAARLDPPALGELFQQVVAELRLAGEAGSLLRIEQAITSAVSTAREQYLRRQRELDKGYLPGLEPPRLQEEFDFTGISDERFFAETEALILEALRSYAQETGDARAYSRRLFAEDAVRGLAFVDVCRQRYDVVLMNPPFGEFAAATRTWAAVAFPRTKNDLYAAFVERGVQLLHPRGLLGAITSRTGFFLSSFQKWREEILLKEAPPIVFADLGYGVLDSAMVEVAAYCLEVAA